MGRPKRPRPVDVGEIRARAVRGRGSKGPDDGRWYWRAEVRRRPVWRGWAHRAELPRILAAVLLEGPADRSPEIADLRTVRDLLEVWIGSVVRPRARVASSLKAQRGSARRIARGIGDCRLDRLGLVAIESWVGRRLAAGGARTTIHGDLGTLRRAWRWGRQIGAVPDRDLIVPPVQYRARPRRTPTPGEVAQVLEHLSATARPWVALAIRLQSALGCRIGELAGLTWDRVDLDRGHAEVVGKTGRRVIPLRSEVAALLSELPQDRDHILGVAPATVGHLNRHLRRASLEVGIAPFSTHGIRRLAVDTLARSGIDVGTAAALLGHSPEVMLSAYRRVSEADLRRAADQLGHLPRGQVLSIAIGHSGRSQSPEDPDGD